MLPGCLAQFSVHALGCLKMLLGFDRKYTWPLLLQRLVLSLECAQLGYLYSNLMLSWNAALNVSESRSIAYNTVPINIPARGVGRGEAPERPGVHFPCLSIWLSK